MTLQFALERRRSPPDMNDERGYERRGNESENALPLRLIDRSKQPAQAEACGDGNHDAPVDGGAQPVATGLVQERRDDGDGEERFESFAKDDDEGAEHWW